MEKLELSSIMQDTTPFMWVNGFCYNMEEGLGQDDNKVLKR